MNTVASEMSQAEAHHELILMDSRVAAVHEEHYFDRFRRMDLPYADLLSRFRELLGESRWCGGKIIHLGKIVGNEILEFMESDPDVPPGVSLGAAVKALIASAPFLGPWLAPLSAEVECQGFNRLFSGSGFVDKQERRAAVSFKRFTTILNINKSLLSSETPAGLDVVTFEEPALFELDSAENPFDLEDVESLSRTASAVVTFLVKIALADGNLGDGEKQMISETVAQMGETLSPSQFERLASRASQEPLENIFTEVDDQPVVFKEKMLLLAMLLSAVDGKVELIEKKLLAQAATLLGVSRKRYSEIASDALSLIKARRLAPAELPKPSVGYIPRGAQSQAWLSSSEKPSGGDARAEAQDPVSLPSRSHPVALGDQARLGREGAAPQGLPSLPPPLQPAGPRNDIPKAPSAAPSQEGASLAEKPRVAEVAQRTSPPLPPVVQSTNPAKIWRCPACRMPQFVEFDECPQCGVIVSKFKDKLSRQGEGTEPEQFIDVPTDPVDEERAEPRASIPSHKEIPSAPTCPGCRTALPADAKFCPSCGTRMA